MESALGPTEPLQDEAIDREMVARIAAGDSSALAAFYDRHCGRVLALCMRILGNRADAEEAVGDAFWQAWEQAARYSPARAEPLAWLLNIARSRAIDRLRNVRRRREAAAEDVGEERGADAGAWSANRPDDPFQAASASRQRERITAVLTSLDPAQREAVEMSFYLGFSHSEIAARLGEPLGTVKTRIRQGLIRLRDALRAQYDQEAGA